MGQVLAGSSTMPMSLPWQDQDNISRCNRALLGFCGNNPLTIGDDQDLLAGM